MTFPIDRGPHIGLRAGLESLHRNWGWYLALGIVLVVVGTIAICSPVFFTITGVLYFGVLMLFGGIAQLLGAFWARYWSGVIAMVLSGLLYLVVGGMTLKHPGTADLALTLLIATFLMVGGLFRIIAALYLRFHGWGWSVLSPWSLWWNPGRSLPLRRPSLQSRPCRPRPRARFRRCLRWSLLSSARSRIRNFRRSPRLLRLRLHRRHRPLLLRRSKTKSTRPRS